jgi:casein kinase II subunit beta
MATRVSSRRSDSREMVIDNFRVRMGPVPPTATNAPRWISQFCHQPQNAWYVAVDRDWIADWFNQHGLNVAFPDFDEAIELIADKQTTAWNHYGPDRITAIHTQALRIYGQMHARWISQPRGLAGMKEKYDAVIFGQCPRFGCNGTHLLPMGTTLTPRRHSAKLYCPMCCDIYRAPPNLSLDGAHFGPAFPHIFIFEYAVCDKSADFRPFVPTAFGFRVRPAPDVRLQIHGTNWHENELLDETRKPEPQPLPMPHPAPRTAPVGR